MGKQREGDGPHAAIAPDSTMPLWPIIAVAIVLFVAWTIVPSVKHWRYRRMIRERTTAEAEWAAGFPGAMPTVEQVLTIFCDAFLFDRRYRFHFRPDDSRNKPPLIQVVGLSRSGATGGFFFGAPTFRRTTRILRCPDGFDG